MSLPYAEMVARHGLGVNHRQMIEAVPHGARVLDVGCASGYLSRALAEERGAVTIGIEPDPGMAAVAAANCGMVHRMTVEAARELPELAV
jgi:2-polyprenyl-3-methyl-5-hydroxy-6-metoxy-1,4-benzoquinol methylase